MGGREGGREGGRGDEKGGRENATQNPREHIPTRIPMTACPPHIFPIASALFVSCVGMCDLLSLRKLQAAHLVGIGVMSASIASQMSARLLPMTCFQQSRRGYDTLWTDALCMSPMAWAEKI